MNKKKYLSGCGAYDCPPVNPKFVPRIEPVDNKSVGLKLKFLVLLPSRFFFKFTVDVPSKLWNNELVWRCFVIASESNKGFGVTSFPNSSDI